MPWPSDSPCWPIAPPATSPGITGFSFGTWKIEVLGASAAPCCWWGAGGVMLFESVAGLLNPSPIHYQRAIGIALLGLLVNLACVRLAAPGTITAITTVITRPP